MDSKKVKKKNEKFRYTKGKFDVVKFYENNTKLFDCIPDIWFVNEEKTLCYWPPKSKKSLTLRAMNQDLPEDDWSVYECEVISEGHATYSIGRSIVREKTSQNYNTSSADEHIQAAKFRREHPGLIHKGEKCFDNIFAAAKVAEMVENEQSTVLNRKTQETSNNTDNNEGHDVEENYVRSPDKTATPNSSFRARSGSIPCNSQSEMNRSRSQSHHSQARSNRSLSRYSSRSRTQNSRSRSGSRNSRSRSDSRNSRSRSGSRNSRSRSGSRNSRSRSGSRNSRSRSGSQKGRSRSVSRNSRSRSGSRNSRSRLGSRNSRSRSGSPNSRSRSGSRNSRSRSGSRISRSRSGSRNSRSESRNRCRSIHSQSSRNRFEPHSKSYNSQTRHNQFQRHNGSQFISCRSPSGRKKLQSSGSYSDSNKQILNSGNRSVQKTNRGNSERRQLAFRTSDCMDGLSRTSFSNTRENRNFNENSEAQRRDYQRQALSAKNDARQPDNNHRKNGSKSPQTRNRLRVQEMYRSHQQRTENRQGHNNRREQNSPQPHSSNDSNILQTLLKEVREIKKSVTKNERRFIESDRRLTRLEVTTNKSFIVLGDLSNAINVRMLLGNTLPREDKPPKGFHTPKMPIKRLNDLKLVNKDLGNKDFFNYLINCEKEFCCHSTSTDTSTMTAYLRRFIDVDLRALIVLKDLKGQERKTLYHDFHNVYQFLIETMKAGYRIKNQIITQKDVHLVLRTVWGRSKQAADEASRKR